MNVENSHLFPVSFFKSVIVSSVFNDNLEGPSIIGNEVEFAIMLLVVRWNRKDAKMPPRWWNVGQFCLGRSDARHVEHLLTNLTLAAIHHRPHHPQAFVNQENLFWHLLTKGVVIFKPVSQLFSHGNDDRVEDGNYHDINWLCWWYWR